MFVKTIEIPIYDMDVIICIHQKHDDVIKKFKLDLDPRDYDDARAFSFADTKSGQLEIFFWLSDANVDSNTIFHEFIHVISYFCQHRDTKYDPKNDEPIAYLGGYIGERIMDTIDLYKKTI